MRVIALGDRDTDLFTHREIDAALELFPDEVDRAWVATESVEARELSSVDGVWLLPGTPYRDDAAAYAAIGHCLAAGTPFLGTCGGFQYACVELARRFAGIDRAAHAETHPDADQIVISPLRCPLYGVWRRVTPVAGSQLASICGAAPFEGFHWCGYGLADAVAERLAAAGVVMSAFADDAGIEGVELTEYPFFIATAFQPQVGAREARRLHPLLQAFVTAAATEAARRLAA